MKDELSSSVLCNLPRPPDEPRLKIAKNGCETPKRKGGKKRKAHLGQLCGSQGSCKGPILPSELPPGTWPWCCFRLHSEATQRKRKERKGTWRRRGRINSHLIPFSHVWAAGLSTRRLHQSTENSTAGKSSLPQRTG